MLAYNGLIAYIYTINQLKTRNDEQRTNCRRRSETNRSDYIHVLGKLWYMKANIKSLVKEYGVSLLDIADVHEVSEREAETVASEEYVYVEAHDKYLAKVNPNYSSMDYQIIAFIEEHGSET